MLEVMTKGGRRDEAEVGPRLRRGRRGVLLPLDLAFLAGLSGCMVEAAESGNQSWSIPAQ
jgi:hypothetical protein